jgi:hypothetical protein
LRDFTCPTCGQQLAFENSVCLSCGADLGFSLTGRALVVIGEPGLGAVDQRQYRLCDNLHLAQCNWIVATGESLCESCRLTRIRPPDDDTAALAAFATAEAAKRRLIFELVELGLPIRTGGVDMARGPGFDLLSGACGPVVTGHSDGVITLDLAEGDDVHREQLRVSMSEPYRTLLGHFRHEIGHYYYPLLVGSGEIARFTELFGDPDADYPAAMDRYYSAGAPPGWADGFVSSYATMHVAEDWAETFAHYLHIRDTLDTAAAFGLAPAAATFDRAPIGRSAFDKIVDLWLPLVWALNMVNRSMGHKDLYPFVLPDPVLAKMRFVHDLITATATAGAPSDD